MFDCETLSSTRQQLAQALRRCANGLAKGADRGTSLNDMVLKMVEAERRTYALTVECLAKDRAVIADRKRTLDDPDCPDELRGLWLDWDAVIRQEKALWLRQVLDDFGF